MLLLEFLNLHSFSFDIPSGVCYHKRVDCPYRGWWVVFYVYRFGVGAPRRFLIKVKPVSLWRETGSMLCRQAAKSFPVPVNGSVCLNIVPYLMPRVKKYLHYGQQKLHLILVFLQMSQITLESLRLINPVYQRIRELLRAHPCCIWGHRYEFY